VSRVDPVAERGGRGGELHPRVDALRLGGVRRDVDTDQFSAVDDAPYRIGEVELALGVHGGEGVERGPERVGAEDVDRRVRLADPELLRRGVGRLDDRDEAAVAVPHDPTVAADVVGDEREHGRRRAAVAVGGEQFGEQRGREERRVAGEHEHLIRPRDRGARRADGVAGAEWALLDRDLDAVERRGGFRRRDDDEGRRLQRPRGLEHPVHHPPPEDRVQVLRERGTHPRPEPSGHHDCGESRRHHG
jgi:hypothetical protein